MTQASKKTDFNVDLLWWGLLRLAPIKHQLMKTIIIVLILQHKYCLFVPSFADHNKLIRYINYCYCYLIILLSMYYCIAHYLIGQNHSWNWLSDFFMITSQASFHHCFSEVNDCGLVTSHTNNAPQQHLCNIHWESCCYISPFLWQQLP